MQGPLKRRPSGMWLAVAMALVVAPLTAGSDAIARDGASKGSWQIFHVMSYHSPWKWTDDLQAGFEYALRDLEVEYTVFQLDTKRRSSEEAKENAGKEAQQLIRNWKPDLVFTTDDNAQKYVARHFVGEDLPFVFAGVNAAPETYGFVGSPNITGVMETEHFIPTVKLLRAIAPQVKRLAVVLDAGPTWDGVVKRMNANLYQVPEVEIVTWDTFETFAQFKAAMKRYPEIVDGVALLGVFNLEGDDGANVPFEVVLRWVAENSTLPDFSFWKTRVELGTLCSVSVAGYQQGYAAGKMAREILVDGRRPSELRMSATAKGEPVISLRRARDLGIPVNSTVLLTTEVFRYYGWEQ